jgi:sRNA-binding carbon storage regulator CsrA
VLTKTKSLTLTRKAGESVIVHGPCTVTVAGRKGGRVLLRFEAAEEVAIVRPDAKKIPGKRLTPNQDQG